MNKYQEALERLENITSVPSIFIEAVVEDLVVIFKELVDRATPRKPLYKIPEYKIRKDGEELAHCPVCEWQLNWKYGCQNNKCRQCIDWSDEE